MELVVGMNDVLRTSLRKGYLDLVIGPPDRRRPGFLIGSRAGGPGGRRGA